MDIQRKAFEESNNVNPDWSFKFDEELQQYVAVDFEMTNQVDEFNEHWDTFRAGWDAKAQAVPEQVLDAPACVGGGTFQKGVKWSTVIGAAQRHYENDGHHEAPAICIRDQLRVASGHSVVVPKEPTYEMLEAGSEARSRTEGHIASIWEAMINEVSK